jgi:transcriptional regulator EpsA
MQAEPVTATQQPTHPFQASAAQLEEQEAGGLARIDPLELESLVVNLDSSLRVHARHHFFNWTQGSLQSLIRHEVLVCALRNGEPMSLHVESFSTLQLDLGQFSEMFRQDAALVPHLIKAWEENHRQPVICETGDKSPFAASPVARELGRIGATRVVAHGTHDAAGRLTSFFAFACQPAEVAPKQAYLAALLVPFLNSAWVRTQVSWPAETAGLKPAVASLLTTREMEILKWLYHGKSNVEIGMILTISPLTVKNHVQKILRKLDVLNRTQAVGKALALRILTA